MHTGILWINILIFAAGLVILIKGSDWFIDASAYTAKRFKVPELVIGLTLVSLGTSLPELATNIYACINNQGSIALGNIVGSNITNVLLILGVGVVMLGSVPIPKPMLKRDGYIMFAISLLCFIMCVIGEQLGRLDGIILLTVSFAYMIYLFRNNDSLEAELDGGDDTPAFKNLRHAIIFIIIGLAMTFTGAKMLVDNVVWAANAMQLNQAVIAATIVALGTSVPELAVTIASVVKKRHGIAMGNIIGSNIFNVGLILGLSAIISPLPIDREMLLVNLPIMLASSALLLIFMRTSWKLVRSEGFILLALYISFIAYNVMKIKL